MPTAQPHVINRTLFFPHVAICLHVQPPQELNSQTNCTQRTQRLISDTVQFLLSPAQFANQWTKECGPKNRRGSFVRGICTRLPKIGEILQGATERVGNVHAPPPFDSFSHAGVNPDPRSEAPHDTPRPSAPSSDSRRQYRPETPWSSAPSPCSPRGEP